jgi:hypothetical protein
LLLLYDGSATHLGCEPVEWAQENNILLMVLPPHSSHLLQPLDVAIFGPMKKSYNTRCLKNNPGQVVSKYNMTALICKSALDAFNNNAIGKIYFKPSKFLTAEDQDLSDEKDSPSSNFENFLANKLIKTVATKKKIKFNKRIPRGQLITEGEGYEIVRENLSAQKKQRISSTECESECEEPKVMIEISDLSTCGRKMWKKVTWLPIPGPSGINVCSSRSDQVFEDSDLSDNGEEDLCCVYKRQFPQRSTQSKQVMTYKLC